MTSSALVRIDDSRLGGQPSLVFEHPHRIITARTLDEVLPALRDVDAATRAGHYAAGFIAYEAGFAFEDRLHALAPDLDPHTPLLWFGIFSSPQQLDFEAAENLWRSDDAKISGFSLHRSAADFADDIDKVHRFLRSGDAYQINHTIRSSFRLEGDPRALYAQLRNGQRSAHAAYIETGDQSILSLSPELFLQKQAATLTTRPMKGTIAKGRFAAEDDAIAATLASDEKSRAENLMIVDLLRNDLARVCDAGSIEVPQLFRVERYPSLLTMTSTITGSIDQDARLADVMPHLFPCGSVTGAPKIRAMEIINGLETSPRGIYTGAIGMMTPQGDFHFNVAIRTAVIDAQNNGQLGIGAGIVADSIAASEYEECKLKARFLTAPQPRFELFETTKYVPGEAYFLKQRHLDRLATSAAYFDIPFNRSDAEALLADYARDFDQPARVRFALSDTGALSLTHRPLTDEDCPGRGHIALAGQHTNSADPFLFHKTSRRALYNQAMQAAVDAGLLDLIFVNQDGFVTEGSRTNIYIEKDGTLVTPPISDGVLAGTMRAALLAQGRAIEAQVKPDDLFSHPCFISNSVMGLVPVQIGKQPNLQK